jgi:D-sedoheptulose 7-phosphate isomerase
MKLNEYLFQYEDIFDFSNFDSLYEIIEYLNKFDRSNKIYVIGNGGSYALAEHFAQDLLKKCNLPAIALTNGSNLTAFSNDVDYYYSFQGQLNTYLNKEDCLICFSSSGNSDNINNACVIAQSKGSKLIVFTGFDGGRISKLADIFIHVPSYNYGIVESIHSMLFHFIVDNLTES